MALGALLSPYIYSIKKAERMSAILAEGEIAAGSIS